MLDSHLVFCIMSRRFVSVLQYVNLLIFQVTNRDQNMNTIKLSFSTKAYDHHLLANGSTHYLGVGAHSGDQMLWIGQDAITFSKVKPLWRIWVE